MRRAWRSEFNGVEIAHSRCASSQVVGEGKELEAIPKAVGGAEVEALGVVFGREVQAIVAQGGVIDAGKDSVVHLAFVEGACVAEGDSEASGVWQLQVFGGGSVEGGVERGAVCRIDVVATHHDAGIPFSGSFGDWSEPYGGRSVLLVVTPFPGAGVLGFEEGFAKGEFDEREWGEADVIDARIEVVNAFAHFFLEVAHTSVEGGGRIHVGSGDVHQPCGAD